jgi:hypothetical protein
MTQNDSHAGATGPKVVPFFLRVALFFLLVCCNVLVAKSVVFTYSIAPGVSFFYTVVTLIIVTTLWFGMYGALAAYAGCYIGAGILIGIPPQLLAVMDDGPGQLIDDPSWQPLPQKYGLASGR